MNEELNKQQKVNEEQKKKIVKAIILSILLFVVASIWQKVVENLKNLYTGGNPFVGFTILTLPCLIVSLLFVREKDFHDSVVFGAVIGFVGVNLFFIYKMIVATPGPSADYSLLPVFLVIFTIFFTGSSVVGSMLSYLIRKPIRKFISQIHE